MKLWAKKLLIFATTLNVASAVAIKKNLRIDLLADGNYNDSNEASADLPPSLGDTTIKEAHDLLKNLASKHAKVFEDLLTNFGQLSLRDALDRVVFDLSNLNDRTREQNRDEEEVKYEALQVVGPHSWQRGGRHPTLADYGAIGDSAAQFSHAFGAEAEKTSDRDGTMSGIIESVRKVVKYNQDVEKNVRYEKLGDAPVQNFDFFNKMRRGS